MSIYEPKGKLIFPDTPLTDYTVPEPKESDDYMRGYNDALKKWLSLRESKKGQQLSPAYFFQLMGHDFYPIDEFAD